jgi:hypothetical protein
VEEQSKHTNEEKSNGRETEVYIAPQKQLTSWWLIPVQLDIY